VVIHEDFIHLASNICFLYILAYSNVSQTVVCRPPLVHGGWQAVLEEKVLKNCIRH
jgi:hypothetical protein